MILTQEQTERKAQYIAEWKAIGLCTDPADRPRAEEAMISLYQNAGLVVPKRKNFIWAGSPFGAAVKYAWLCQGVYTLSQNSRMDRAIMIGLRDNNISCDWKLAREGSAGSIHGQHDANWLAFYAFCREVCGKIKETEHLVPLFKLARSSGWVIPCEDMIIFSERPSIIKHENGEFHCDDGPALVYRDGWEIHAIHGNRISKKQFYRHKVLSSKELHINIDKEQICG